MTDLYRYRSTAGAIFYGTQLTPVLAQRWTGAPWRIADADATDQQDQVAAWLPPVNHRRFAASG